MNELQIIRQQLTTERDRAVEVAAALAAPTGAPQPTAADAVRQASVDYLVFVLARFEERDQMLRDLIRARLAESDATRSALQEALARPGASREALAKLEAALAAQSPEIAGRKPSAPTGASSTPLAEFAACVAGPWRARRDAIDVLQEARLRITDWRGVSFVDADSIVEERTRYARVQSARSAGAS